MRRTKGKDDEPTDFARGNFKSKRDEEAPKRDGPPRFTRGEKRDTDKKADDTGFGFRSNPKGKGKKWEWDILNTIYKLKYYNKYWLT